MVEVGFFTLCLGLCFAIYSLVLGIYSLRSPISGLVASARNALLAVFICVAISSLVMWNAIFFHDFSILYVYRNSAIDMPPLYLLTSFWSSLEGSHLLWTLTMSAVVAIACITVKKSDFSLYPGLCVAFASSLTFMLFLNVTYSAPLSRLFPVGKFGEGMNALLQNPYMAIHPPMLFTGYCLLIVPFAYSFAALARGGFTTNWLSVVRTWSLLAWVTLTVAIFLGGKWAYVELGWGGYWGWDPVENSSFMPWLAATAALHTLLITDKTGRLPRLLVFLNMLAFALTFLGTFITRSGVISSVHSFAESEIGPSYLLWVIFLFVVSLGLLFTKGYQLYGAARTNVWRVSKESALLFTIFFLLFMLALVFIGTILPLVVEAIRGIKISIQQPFFNAFAPWIGFGLVLLLGLGNLMKWKNGKIEDPVSCLLFPLIWATVLTYFINLRSHLDYFGILTFLIVLWTCGVLIMDLVYKLRSMRWNGMVFLKYNRSYLGALIIHIGFLFAIVGFAGNYRGVSAETNLNLKESTIFHGYQITNEGLSFKRDYNAQFIAANLKATNLHNQETVYVHPMRSKFTNNEQWFNEIGIYSTFWHDLYIVLASFDVNNQSVTLKINWNPTVKFVWTSLVIMVLGAVIAMTQTSRRRRVDEIENEQDFNITSELQKVAEHRTELKKNSGSEIVSGVILGFVFVMISFAIIGVASAQSEQKNSVSLPGIVKPQVIDPRIEDIAKDLRCPTCVGISVLESETLQSIAMRSEIEKQLAEGKAKAEILNYFKKAYGPWILREPDAHSAIGLTIWIIPILGLILGPVLLMILLRRSQIRQKEKDKKLMSEITKFIEECKQEKIT
jgi:cytochrome c-type biogenesis protein CcmF